VTAFLGEIARRDPVLWVTGLIHLALALAFLVGLVVDERVILGVNPWLKPLKFAARSCRAGPSCPPDPAPAYQPSVPGSPLKGPSSSDVTQPP
jgi:hypothetical protein